MNELKNLLESNGYAVDTEKNTISKSGKTKSFEFTGLMNAKKEFLGNGISIENHMIELSQSKEKFLSDLEQIF